MENEATKLRKKVGIMKWVALAGAVAIIAPVGVNAATNNVVIKDRNSASKAEVSGSGAVKVGGSVNAKVKGTGGNLDSEAIPAQGPLEFVGSDGALDVRTYAGGAGFLGAADCDAANPGAGDFFPEDLIVPGGTVVTTVMLTGTNSKWDLKASALGNATVNTFRLTPDNPQMAVSIPTGLGLTAPVTLDCSPISGDPVDGQAAAIGHPSKG